MTIKRCVAATHIPIIGSSSRSLLLNPCTPTAPHRWPAEIADPSIGRERLWETFVASVRWRLAGCRSRRRSRPSSSARRRATSTGQVFGRKSVFGGPATRFFHLSEPSRASLFATSAPAKPLIATTSPTSPMTARSCACGNVHVHHLLPTEASSARWNTALRSWKDNSFVPLIHATTADIAKIINDTVPEVAAVVHKFRALIERVDVARYALMYRDGGVYADADHELVSASLLQGGVEAKGFVLRTRARLRGNRR